MRKFDYLVRFVWCNQVSFPKFKIWFNVIDSQETLEQQHRAFKTFTVFSEFKINLTSICIDINTKELYKSSFKQQYLAFEEFSNTNWEFSVLCHFGVMVWVFLNLSFKIWCNILLCYCAIAHSRHSENSPKSQPGILPQNGRSSQHASRKLIHLEFHVFKFTLY